MKSRNLNKLNNFVNCFGPSSVQEFKLEVPSCFAFLCCRIKFVFFSRESEFHPQVLFSVSLISNRNNMGCSVSNDIDV